MNAALGTRTESVTQVLRDLDHAYAAGTVTPSEVPTGLASLDIHLGGALRAGDLAILAGAQGVGKTTLALQAVRNVAASGRPATYVCFEHSATELVERLVVMEANLAVGDSAPSLGEVHDLLGRPGTGGLGERLGHLPGMERALAAVEEYGAWLTIVEARGEQTTVSDVHAAASRHSYAGLLVVDYVQKLRSDQSRASSDVGHVATTLKDIALDTGQVVLAVSALEREGLVAHRVRARHLKGSVVLAYEADVILVLQRKWDVVARDQLVFNLAAAQRLHDWVVLSIEKNRHGEDRVDLAFRKRLSRGYFDPDGHVEDDPLLDERLVVGQ